MTAAHLWRHSGKLAQASLDDCLSGAETPLVRGRLVLLVVLLSFGVASVTAASARFSGVPSLAHRVLAANELPGFVPDRVQTTADADEWAKIAPDALVNVAARLRFEGFSGGVREDLKATKSDRGALSIVVRLRSQAAASRELGLQRRDYATESRRLHGHTTTPFAVRSIPAAYAFTATDPGGGFGINVIFADGRFVYHVGAGWGQGASHPPTKQDVVAAVTRLYNRVRTR